MRAFGRLGGSLGKFIFWVFNRRTVKGKVAVIVAVLGFAVVGMVGNHVNDSKTAKVENGWYQQDKKASNKLAHEKFKVPSKKVCTVTTSTVTTNGAATGKHHTVKHSTTTTHKKVCK